MVYVMGGVFSCAARVASLMGLIGPFAFHAICMGLGAFLMGKARPVKQTV